MFVICAWWSAYGFSSIQLAIHFLFNSLPFSNPPLGPNKDSNLPLSSAALNASSAWGLKYTPLVLDFIDGDRKNHLYENLRMLCFNCSFLINGNLTGPRKEYEY